MQGQSLQQTQQQRQLINLSPMQIKYFKMLEMNRVEAEEEVRRALEDNPALDTVDSETLMPDFNESAEELQRADYGSEEEIPFYRLHVNNHSADDSFYTPEAVAESTTLSDHLDSELNMIEGVDPHVLKVARYVAGNLDSNGYMTRSAQEMIDDIAISTGIEVGEKEMKEAIALVRSLDPPGVGAVDLRDCLLLQLDRLPSSPKVNIAREIVAHYFDLFSHKHYDRLMSAIGVKQDRLREAIECITDLNPKPGSVIESTDANDRLRHVNPDFQVDTDSDGNVTATVLSNIPELQIEATFASESPETAKNGATDAFIRKQRDEASGFINIIKLRNETLMKVISAIVKIQHDFFVTGDESTLHPMILKDISSVTGLDTSVVSRATSGKYVMTPWGIYPLKFFFNERFSHDDNDEDVSSREIIAALREIIDNEDHHHPLADREIAERLAFKGHNVARRTVAKYREMLGYPVARLRRQL